MAETGQSFIKKIIGFSFVTWITFALSFITAPISTRLFNPDVLGKINIFNTYSNLFGVLILIGLDQAYARFYNERPNNRSKGYLLSFCFATAYALVFILSAIAVPFHDTLSVVLFDETTNFSLILLFISVFCTASLRYLNLTYRMEQDIRMFTIQGVLMAVVSKILHIIVGFWNPSYEPALLVSTIAHLLLTVIFIIIQHNRFDKIKIVDSFFAKELFRFAIPLIPVSILSWLNSSIPQLVMQRTMDYYSIGVFTSAMALANLILVIQSGFNSFWVPYTYENYKTQTGQFFKIHRCLVCILTIFALILICSQDIIFLLLGQKYRAAKEFFPFLILGPVCYVVGEVAGVGINISKKTYYNVVVFISSVIVNIVACLALRIPLGVAGIAMATSFAAITAMVVKTIIGERFYKVVISYKYMFFCVIILLVASAATLWIHNPYIRFATTVCLLISSCIFYRKEMFELFNVALSFMRKNKTL